MYQICLARSASARRSIGSQFSICNLQWRCRTILMLSGVNQASTDLFLSEWSLRMPAAAKKARYTVRNWSEYNDSLVARGSITVWFSEEALQHWYHANSTCKRGRPFKYSDSTIELFLTIRELLRLPYRQTEGFIGGILGLIQEGLAVPDFTSAAKRAAKLGISLPVLPRQGN